MRKLIVQKSNATVQSEKPILSSVRYALTPADVNGINARYSLTPKYRMGEYTRAYACVVCTLSLIEKQGSCTMQNIDDLIFASFGFSISERKIDPTATLKKGGLKLAIRINRYLVGDKKEAPYSEHIASQLNVNQDMGIISPVKELASQIEARDAQASRVKLYKEARERAILIRKKLISVSPVSKGSKGLPESLKRHLGIKS